MQAKAKVAGTKNLYDFRSNRIYEAVLPADQTILNLASTEYSKAIEKYHLLLQRRYGKRMAQQCFGSIHPGAAQHPWHWLYFSN